MSKEILLQYAKGGKIEDDIRVKRALELGNVKRKDIQKFIEIADKNPMLAMRITHGISDINGRDLLNNSE